MPTRNIHLTNHFDEFVEEQIASGRFKNASEVLRAGLRLLENETAEEREKLAVLRRLAKQGLGELDRGEGTEIEGNDQLAQFIAAVGYRAAQQTTASPGSE